MVTLTGLEPATSPAPGENKDALSPLELQRLYNPHGRLWRRKGGLGPIRVFDVVWARRI
jgi:hypothetical protein